MSDESVMVPACREEYDKHAAEQQERERCIAVVRAIRDGIEIEVSDDVVSLNMSDALDIIIRERAAARAEVEAEVARLRAERDELQRLGRSGYTITMERRLRDSREQHAALADAAREAEAMLRMRSGTGFAETAANLRAAISGAPVSELLRHLQVTTDAHGAAELRIVELRAERDQLRAKLARVEPLPAKWRETSAWHIHAEAQGNTCAAELEAALRDEGSS